MKQSDYHTNIPAMAWAPESVSYLNYEKVIRETPKSVLILLKRKSGGTHEEWLPKSQIEFIDNPKCVKVPNWLKHKIGDNIRKK